MYLPDIRLPYFYNLPIAVLLGFYIWSRLERLLLFLVACDGSPQLLGVGAADTLWLIYLKTFLTVLPAASAAIHFLQQFSRRNDLSLRETIFILTAVNILTSLISVFLR